MPVVLTASLEIFHWEKIRRGGWRRRCWWWECGRGCFHPPPPLPPPPMRWALSSFPPPRLLQAEHGCSGIPWRHETVAVETTVTKTGRHLLIPRGPPISYIGWLEQRQFRAERGRLEFSLRVWCHIKNQRYLTVRGPGPQRKYHCIFLLHIFKLLDICLSLNMAVTEAGCDLTYCKMRGIVAVLTGEPKKWHLFLQRYPNIHH